MPTTARAAKPVSLCARPTVSQLIAADQRVKGIHVWCEVDLERCIGCAVRHVPKRKSNPYELKICPWDAIQMVPTQCLPDAAACQHRRSDAVQALAQNRASWFVGIAAQRVADS